MTEDASRLDPDEPTTPLWLTLLGGALFLAVALFLVASADSSDEAAEVAAPEVDEAPVEAAVPNTAQD